jgi:predicted esterase
MRFSEDSFMNSLKPLDTPTVEARGPKHTATIIFLHGLGDANSSGWRAVAEDIAHKMDYVKIILPNAPIRAITSFGGYKMNAWFDLKANLGEYNTMLESVEDEEGILESVRAVGRIVADEVGMGIPANRIVIGGFSAGGAMALATGLTSEYKFAAIIGLSGYVPMRNKLLLMLSDTNRRTKIFMAHGDRDPVIDHSIGDICRQLLETKDYTVTFKSYSMGHQTCIAEMQDMFQFLWETIPPLPAS